MTQRIITSAPGKVILFGEHAVVHGKTAIATALGLRTYALLETKNDNSITLKLPDMKVDRTWYKDDVEKLIESCPAPPSHLQIAPDYNGKRFEEFVSEVEKFCAPIEHGNTIDRGVAAFLYLYISLLKQKLLTTNDSKYKTGITMTVKSLLPVGMGLGSSAAYSVAISSALITFFEVKKQGEEQDVTNQYINGWAFQCEKIIHGNPSGIDNTVSTLGGTLTLTKTSEGVKIEQLKKTPKLEFLLTNTKVPRNTHSLVKKVGEIYESDKVAIGNVLNEIHDISLKCIDLFNNTNDDNDDKNMNTHLYESLEKLIDRNHYLLGVLGVGHIALDNVCNVTIKYGLHSKLTGAGGGGCSLTLIRKGINDNIIKDIRNDIHNLGYDSFKAEVGGSGVIIHNISNHGDIMNSIFI